MDATREHGSIGIEGVRCPKCGSTNFVCENSHRCGPSSEVCAFIEALESADEQTREHMMGVLRAAGGKRNAWIGSARWSGLVSSRSCVRVASGPTFRAARRVSTASSRSCSLKSITRTTPCRI